MNFLVDVTAVDYSAFGKRPAPAFFSSSGVAVSPSPQIPDEDPWPGPPGQSRFAVVYHFYSTTKRHGPLTMKCRTPDRVDCKIPSVTPLWRSAEYQEREAFDLYGVVFEGHPDLRRILMWDEFTDFPMRKDYKAPDDYEWEPTPHDDVVKRIKERA